MQICDISSLNDFQKSSQISCLNSCKVTIIGDAQNLFLNVFSSRLFQQMQSHNSCMCVIFSNGSFHMSSQIAYLNRCKVTIVADVRNSSIKKFSTSSQIACFKRCKLTIDADMQKFSIKLFSYVFSNCLLDQMKSHKSCMCVIFSNVSFPVSS